MMLSAAQSSVRDAVRTFAQERVRPLARSFESAGGYPTSLFGDLGDLGLMGMMAPESVGGAGVDHVSFVLALIELAAADGALSTIVSVQNSLIVSALLKNGSDQQQSRFLPDLIAGRAIGAFALTESEAGSDAAALRTRARKTDGGYLLNGSKHFITSGQIAKITIVYAVTDPEAGRNGITAFIVPSGRAGYSIEKVERKLGQWASDTCSVRLADVFVDDGLRLGVEGAGYGIALANLEVGRMGIAAQSVGMAQAALEIAVKYAKERETFGKPIMEHQAVGCRLADLATRLEAARQLVLAAASLKDAGEHCQRYSSMAKLFGSETAEAVVSGALQTLGGYGYLEDYNLAKIYRDVRVCQIYEGTSDIQRMLIARSL